MIEILSYVATGIVALILILGIIAVIRYRKKAGKPGLPAKYLLAIPVVVLLGFGVWWGISSLGSPASPVTPSSSGWSMQSPSLEAVWATTQNYWHWILLACIAAYVLGSVFPRAKILQWLSGLAVVLFFVGFPLLGWLTSPSPALVARTVVPSTRVECTASRPCDSVGKTHVPEGTDVCFDPSIWQNIAKLGQTTSFKGRPEKKYECTKDQVIAGTCSHGHYDTFWFVPEPGVKVPQHWFAPEGTGKC